MSKIPQNIIDQLCELSCETVAEKLGIVVNRHKAICFMHDDHHPSLYFSGRNRERWWCFVCNKGGSAINLVMEYSDLDFIDACQWLGQEFAIIINSESNANRPIRKLKIRKRISKDEVKPFSTDVAQWILNNNGITLTGRNFLYNQRRLLPEIIECLGVVSIDDSLTLVAKLAKIFDSNVLKESGLISCTNGKLYFRMFTPCLIFPYFDRNGELVGLQSRYLGTNHDAPRFQFISSQKTRVYNLPILNYLKNGDELYISEGITDCLALLSAGKNAVAIPSATILPRIDLVGLKTYKLRMYPDRDDAGKKAYKELRRFFINHGTFIEEDLLPDGIKDYSELYLELYGNNR